jgi:nucleotide-binding universal stress UspA family protein
MIVKPPANPIVKVLVGVDGSEDSRAAVKFLRRFPLPPEVSVCMAHVVHVPSPAFGEHKGYYETAELGGELERLKTAAEVDGKKILDEAAKLLEGVHVETVVTAGPPAQRLVDLAGEKGVSLLVVGSRGLTGVERFLMGSVSLQICHQAPSTVLVVRS